MWIVAGLFESRGIAEDAGNRLRAEGMPDGKIAIRTLRETGPVPKTVDAELAALSLDPMVLGDVRHKFVDHIRNGETLAIIGAESTAEIKFAEETMSLYGPIAIEVLNVEMRRVEGT
jgi:hypothetical protein